jgi:hypothetical protein
LTLHFLNTNFLWLIIPAVLLAFLFGYKNKRFAGWHKISMVIISIISISTILAALAEPYITKNKTQNQTQVFLLDVSRSISDTDLANAAQAVNTTYKSTDQNTKKVIICFSAYPIELPISELEKNKWDIAQMRQAKQGVFAQFSTNYYESTNIQSAILFAKTLIKQNGIVHVYTDGLETNGQLQAAISQCTNQDIDFKFEKINSSQNNEVILSDILIPQQVRQGQNTAIKAIIESTDAAAIKIEMTNLQNQKKEVFNYNIQKGINTINLAIDTSNPPAASYEISVLSEKDTDKTNNTKKAAIQITPKPTVYVLETDPQQQTLDTIKNWLTDSASVKSLSDPTELYKADALIIADADVNTITPQIAKIKTAIENGMGMIVFPGYQMVQNKLLLDNDFADLLPVKVHQYGRKSNPDTTVVFILDTSGSMTGARIAIAREIARQAIGRLSPYDKVGIVEFYGNRRWAAPIQSAANQVELYRAINRLTSGGGTVIMPAMEEAYYALLNVSSTTKHIVVISDGGVEHAAYEQIVRKMADSRIAVSTVLVGPPSHTNFMAELSQWGQGSFFNAEDRFVLPDINFKSVFDKAGSPFQQNTAPLSSKYPSGIISVDNVAVNLEYLASQPKTASQTAVEFSNGQPFIAMWNYGIGKVAFCASDIFHQNSANGNTLSGMISNLARKTYKQWSTDWNMQHTQINDELEIEIQSVNTGSNPQNKPSTLVIHSDNADDLKMPLLNHNNQTYATSIKDLSNGIYSIEAQNNTGTVLTKDWAGFNSIPEIKSCQADTALLEKAQRISDSHEKTSTINENIKTTMLWLPCLITGLIMFLAHITVRRLPVRSKAVSAVLVFILILSCQNNTFAQSSDPNDVLAQNMQTAFSEVSSSLDKDNANLPLLALLCGDYNLAESEFNKKPIDTYFNSMLCGYNFYKLSKFQQAYEAFYKAEKFTTSEQDKKFALAWAMRMAEKAGKTDDLEAKILDSNSFARHDCQILCSLYALNSNIEGLIHLREKIESLLRFNEADKDALEQEIINISIIGNTNTLDFQKQSANPDNTALLGQVRKYLINNNRSQAEELLEKMIADSNSAAHLLFIANNASQMAFYDLADKAAAKIPSQDSLFYAAGIFRINLALSRGDQPKAAKLLNDLQSTIKPDDRQEFEIAQYYEKMGQYPTAIEKYQQIYSRTGAMDVLMRVSWLYEKNYDFEKAYQIWLTIWEDCKQDSLLRQVQPRLLEIASRTSHLAELAVQKEEALEKSGLDIKTLELLVDIYVSVGDSFSAVDLVKKYCGQSDTPSLERQYRIYLRSHEYGRCRRILKQLMVADPNHSNDYLRQLALLAVEKGNEKDTMNVIKSIQARKNSSSQDLEYIAGIWDLLEQPEYAMQTYGLLLQKDSYAAETWLLWAEAAKNANHKDVAVNALAQLLATDTSDDLFAVAVDALLNLDAEDAYLNQALKQIYIRIAENPKKVFLYRLAIDVLSETSKSGDFSDFLFAASAYSADGRIAWIQEAQRGTLKNETDSLDYGMVLVYMDSKLSPTVCIELGKAFLELGEYKTAWFLFHKTNFIFENSNLSLDIANGYDGVGQFDLAALVIREAISVTPDDLQLLVRSASYNEIDGNFPQAFKEYFKAYQLSLNGISRPENKDPNQKENNLNVESDTRFRQIALSGILSTIDNNNSEVLKFIEYKIIETCKSANLEDNKSRLQQLCNDYQQLSAAIASSDTALNSIIDQFPTIAEILKENTAEAVTDSNLAAIIAKNEAKAQNAIDDLANPKEMQQKEKDKDKSKSIDARAFAKTLLSSDANNRMAQIEQAVNSQPASLKRMFMLNLAIELKNDLNEIEQQKYIEIFQSQPQIKFLKSLYITLSRLNTGEESNALVSNIAETLLSEMPDNLSVNAFAASVRFKAGQQQQASALAADVIDNLTRANEINFEFNNILKDMTSILTQDEIRTIITELEMSQDVIGSSAQLYFITATLHKTLGEEELARQQIKQCFLRIPDNFSVVRMMTLLYDNTGYRKELAEIISSNINSAGLSATLQWRNLVRLYYQTRQYEKMAQAAARDTTPLHNLNYLIMYQDSNNITQLVRYFRKYQTDMRVDERFFAPVWPDWTDFGGIKQYQHLKNNEHIDLYRALASTPALWPDYERYWNSISPQRSDFDKFADVYAYILFTQNKSKQRIDDLIQKSLNAPLTQKEYTLLSCLLKYETDAGNSIDNAIVEKFESMTTGENADAWRIIAKASKANGQTEKAAMYYKLLSLNQIAQKAMLPSLFDDLDNWLQLDSANTKQALAFLMPLLNADSLSFKRDDFESAKTNFIQKYCDADIYQTRIRSIEKVIWNDEYNTTYNPLRFDLLKYYISQDDQDSFMTNYKKLLAVKEISNRQYFVDYSKLASSAGSEDKIDKYFSMMQTEIDSQYKQNIISSDEAVQNLSLLAVALYQNNAKTQADSVLENAKQYIKEPSLTSLWLADALRLCDKADQADIIENELNIKGLIPNARLKK